MSDSTQALEELTSGGLVIWCPLELSLKIAQPRTAHGSSSFALILFAVDWVLLIKVIMIIDHFHISPRWWQRNLEGIAAAAATC